MPRKAFKKQRQEAQKHKQGKNGGNQAPKGGKNQKWRVFLFNWHRNVPGAPIAPEKNTRLRGLELFCASPARTGFSQILLSNRSRRCKPPNKPLALAEGYHGPHINHYRWCLPRPRFGKLFDTIDLIHMWKDLTPLVEQLPGAVFLSSFWYNQLDFR